ncbi:unnamed protein product [Lactuca saligna]|uniref:Zinc finger PHD-type domain-containing protein n=1 Tax=Lactuca saligna TaxID=75948 RepID=A0AA35ZFZ7_LACSI|nr:unnamed protein product [Lactuca saligna]
MPRRPSFYIFFNAKGLHACHFPLNMDITKEREDMEEINHFSHSHPLKLVNMETILGANFDSHGGGGGEEKEKPGVIGCYACQNPILSGFVYGCIQCRHFMHTKCSQVAPAINLPSLYKHPLRVFDFGVEPDLSWGCYLCRNKKRKRGFCYFYNKPEYNIGFNACIDCCLVEIARKAEVDAIKEEGRIKIEHEGHPQHTLSLKLRPNAVLCNACKAKDEGLFYECDSCDFWIHKTCASLSSTIHLPNHHNHPLALVYSLPEKFFKFAYYCEFCSIYIRWNDWLYHCANCRYFAHIRCALTAEQPSIQRDGPSTSTVDEDENGLLHFPMSDEFTDPLKLQHYEKMTQDDDDDEKTVIEHQHWSHEHPLILHVQHQANNMSCSSDPIEVCFGYGNTFLYKCETCEFNLDVNCAFLPNTIKHKSHKHPLMQIIDPQPLCNACNLWSNGIAKDMKFH